MFKRLVFALFILISVSSCSEKQPIVGIDGSAIPPAFANFPDMPFPA